MDHCHLYLLIWSTLTLAWVTQSAPLKFCVVRNHRTGKHIHDTCVEINKREIECVIVSDRLQCMRHIVAGKADFAVFEPEDIFAVTLAYPNTGHILMTHELRLFPNASSSFEMVLVVREGIRSRGDLIGKGLCHPGYDSVDNDWAPLYADYMQNQIMSKSCDLSLTLLENKFAGLSEYFGRSCFPGVWAFSSEWADDQQMKSNYTNLCSNCEAGACKRSDPYAGRAGAVRCLIENAGDVAWVRLSDAQELFKMEHINTSQYKFMCPDGLVRPWNSAQDPCTWITRPWPVIGAYRENAKRIAKKMDELMEPKYDWHNLLLRILMPFKSTIVQVEAHKTPQDFLHDFPGLSSAYAGSTCRPSRKIRWCVSSYLEYSKCQWLSYAASSYGFEPELNCLQIAGSNASMHSVSTGFCEFSIALPEELQAARKKNLTAAVHFVASDPMDLHNIAAFVRTDSEYRTIEDLKGARACFPKVHSVAWNSFVAVMGNRSRDPSWNCSDDRAVYRFFGEVVVAAANRSVDMETPSTFECLRSGRGDVAFFAVQRNFRRIETFRRICVEGGDDTKCILSWNPLASVMVANRTPDIRRREIITVLEQLNTWFGVRFPAPTPAISLYESFEGHNEVIFPELSFKLTTNLNHIDLPRNYPSILDRLESTPSPRHICGSASTHSYISVLIPLTIAMLIQ